MDTEGSIAGRHIRVSEIKRWQFGSLKCMLKWKDATKSFDIKWEQFRKGFFFSIQNLDFFLNHSKHKKTRINQTHIENLSVLVEFWFVSLRKKRDSSSSVTFCVLFLPLFWQTRWREMEDRKWTSSESVSNNTSSVSCFAAYLPAKVLTGQDRCLCTPNASSPSRLHLFLHPSLRLSVAIWSNNSRNLSEEKKKVQTRENSTWKSGLVIRIISESLYSLFIF